GRLRNQPKHNQAQDEQNALECAGAASQAIFRAWGCAPLPASCGFSARVPLLESRNQFFVRHAFTIARITGFVTPAAFSAFRVSGSVSKFASARSIFATMTFADRPAATRSRTC